MNAFDVVVLALSAILALVGLWKGLVRILIGIGALVAAFVIASRFHETLADRMTWLDFSVESRKLVAYLLLFLGTMLAGALVGWVCRRLLSAAMLGWADRLAGGALGLAAAALLAALVLLPLVAYAPVAEPLLAESMLAPYVTVVGDLARTVAPDGLSERYRERVERLRQYWADHWGGGTE